MNKLIILLIALCFCMILGLAKAIKGELSDLKARDRLRSIEIIALRGQIGVVDDKTDRIVGEVRDVVRPFSHIIPVDGGFLGVRE